MLGALVALGAVPVIEQRWVRELLAAAGIALIAFAVFFYTSDTPFPGAAALAPCFGAALLIYAGSSEQTVASGVLSLSPLVFIGRISYSLYLWHWPLYVFTRYFTYRDPAPEAVVCLIAASFALAIASYYFVEQPFRNGRFRVPAPRLFGGGATAMTAVAAASLVLLQADGLPQRLRPDLRSILAEENDHEPHIDTCLGISPEAVRDGKMCQIGVIGGKPSFILWGDSHADAVLPAISEAAQREGRTGLFAGGRSCPPLLDVTTPRPECRAFNQNVLAQAARPEIREVILEARWAKYAEGSTYGAEPEGHIVLTDDGGTDDTSNHAVFARGLARTVKALAGKKIVIVASVPEIGWPVPAVLAREKLADKMRIAPPSTDAYFERQKFVLATFAALQRKDGVTIVYPHEVLCRSGACAVSLNGIPLYRDEHHLSVYGAHQLTALFMDAM